MVRLAAQGVGEVSFRVRPRRAVDRGGPVPRSLRPVFRDRADFSAGPLQAQTIEALKNSQFLIVIASPHSAASDYVNEEIRLFKSFGGEGRVLSLIVEGEPPVGAGLVSVSMMSSLLVVARTGLGSSIAPDASAGSRAIRTVRTRGRFTPPS